MQSLSLLVLYFWGTEISLCLLHTFIPPSPYEMLEGLELIQVLALHRIRENLLPDAITIVVNLLIIYFLPHSFYIICFAPPLELVRSFELLPLKEASLEKDSEGLFQIMGQVENFSGIDYILTSIIPVGVCSVTSIT